MHVSEASKAQVLERRQFQGLLMLDGHGIDVGAGKPGLGDSAWWEKAGLQCTPWDLEQGDAHDLLGVPDGHYDWLFSSHCLEHLAYPDRALANWARVVRHGGQMLLSVPHRTLYEGRTMLPSKWNPTGHLRFYLPYEDDAPHTVGLYKWLRKMEQELPIKLVQLVTGDWGNTVTGRDQHPDGEYQIDALIEVL